MSIIITIGSVTTAARLTRLVEKHVTKNVRAAHTPEKLAEGGCSYSLITDMRYLADIKALAEKHGIPIRKIYAETIVGGERVYSEISR